MEKLLGKISSAEYGLISDYPFLMGLQLGFSMKSSGIGDGGIFCVNMSPDCNWVEKKRKTVIEEKQEIVFKLLNDAKVSYVSDLIGKPVEVTIENSTFKSFRILTEVL